MFVLPGPPKKLMFVLRTAIWTCSCRPACCDHVGQINLFLSREGYTYTLRIKQEVRKNIASHHVNPTTSVTRPCGRTYRYNWKFGIPNKTQKISINCNYPQDNVQLCCKPADSACTESQNWYE